MPGMNVLVRSTKNKKRFIRGTIVGQLKSNYPTGHFYRVCYDSNYHVQTVKGSRIVPYILIQQVNHAGKVV